MRTEIGPLQRLIGKPDLKPATVLLRVEPRNSEAGTVHRDRITNMAVPEYWPCIRYGQFTAPAIAGNSSDGS